MRSLVQIMVGYPLAGYSKHKNDEIGTTNDGSLMDKPIHHAHHSHHDVTVSSTTTQ
jgi:hypothetical protein